MRENVSWEITRQTQFWPFPKIVARNQLTKETVINYGEGGLHNGKIMKLFAPALLRQLQYGLNIILPQTFLCQILNGPPKYTVHITILSRSICENAYINTFSTTTTNILQPPPHRRDSPVRRWAISPLYIPRRLAGRHTSVCCNVWPPWT